jgi:hypothetical protein
VRGRVIYRAGDDEHSELAAARRQVEDAAARLQQGA